MCYASYASGGESLTLSYVCVRGWVYRFEPYAMPLLPLMLQHIGSKNGVVKANAEAACRQTIVSLNPRAARLVLPILFEGPPPPRLPSPVSLSPSPPNM